MSARRILAFLIALTPAAIAAASTPPPPVPPAPILTLASSVVKASNTDDEALLARLYTGDATVVDEIPPFVWRGAGAGVAWWRAVEAFTKTKHVRLKLVDVRISEFQRSSTAAYLIQPLTILELGNGQPSSESGTMTYTFHNDGGRWLISSQVWATKP